MRQLLLICTACAALLVGCSEEGSTWSGWDGGGGPEQSVADQAPGADLPHKLSAISVTPNNTVLEVNLNTAAKHPFKATGHYLDGLSEDLSARVAWSSDNPKLGSFSGAALDIPAFSKTVAHVTRVGATVEGITGQAQLTVVAYRKSGAKQDFFFVLPHKDKKGQQQRTLTFKTDVRNLDVFFAMDTTGSMKEEIANLQAGLTGTVVPGITAAVPGAQFGVGAVMDFPLLPYGAPGVDQPFVLLQTITAATTSVQQAVNKYSKNGSPMGSGGDLPESFIEALYQIATGKGLTGPWPTKVPANTSGVGGVGFRKGSMPVVVAITDAMFHAPGENNTCFISNSNYAAPVLQVAHTRVQAQAALAAICGRVVGVAPVASCDGVVDLEFFARATGARVPPETWDVPSRPPGCAKGMCCTALKGAGRKPDKDGLCPLVFKLKADGSGLSSTVVTGLKMLTRYAPFSVKAAVTGTKTDQEGKALPAGKTTADFIKGVLPDSFTKPAPPPKLPDPKKGKDGFSMVTPGTSVTFKVLAFNDFLQATGAARIFRVVIKVTAGGCTDLDQREVLILVPPKAIIK